MVPKEKFILGIFVTIVGGTLFITSLVFGIISITNGLYEDAYTFPVRLSLKNNQDIAGTFSARTDEVLSFWLKVPDRRIENKDFQLSVIIDDLTSREKTTWHSDFNLGYLRNSSGQGQYYQLGTHRFKKDFYGSLNYIAHGQWVAPYNAYLVIRRVKSLQLPKLHILLFTIGFIMLFQGINSLQKNLKRMCDESSHKEAENK
ncbi:MAG: hypothetical protein L6416_11405 [Candidatus Omnitrophica bacterium]|nr:hypothetical protein [Candidatus Omnitrophota bacterium]